MPAPNLKKAHLCSDILASCKDLAQRILLLSSTAIIGLSNIAIAAPQTSELNTSSEHRGLSELSLRYTQLTGSSDKRLYHSEQSEALRASVVLERRSESGSSKFSNAALIGEGPCFALFATAGHSLYDRINRRVGAASTVRLHLGSGSTSGSVNDLASLEALQLMISPAYRPGHSEADWGLVLAKKPRCHQDLSTHYPGLKPYPLAALTSLTDSCDTVFACHDTQSMRFTKTEDCHIDWRQSEKLALFDCPQRQGMSGCAMLCKNKGSKQRSALSSSASSSSQDEFAALGIFTYGLRERPEVELDSTALAERQESPHTTLQSVGVLRLFSEEFLDKINALKHRYGME